MDTSVSRTDTHLESIEAPFASHSTLASAETLSLAFAGLLRNSRRGQRYFLLLKKVFSTLFLRRSHAGFKTSPRLRPRSSPSSIKKAGQSSLLASTADRWSVLLRLLHLHHLLHLLLRLLLRLIDLQHRLGVLLDRGIHSLRRVHRTGYLLRG